MQEPDEAAVAAAPVRARDLANACFSAGQYALRCWPQALKLSLVCLAGLFVNEALWLLLLLVPFGLIISTLAGFAITIGTWGCAIRFLLEVTRRTSTGDHDPPEVAPWDTRKQVRAYFLALGINLVYAAPILTLPLSPVGWWLGAQGHGLASLDAVAALKRVWRKPSCWLIVLGISILWGILSLFPIGGIIALTFPLYAWGEKVRPSQLADAMPFLAAVLGLGWLTFLVAVFFAIVAARCVGLGARYYGAVVPSEPRPPSEGRAGFCLAGGLVAFALLTWGEFEAGRQYAEFQREEARQALERHKEEGRHQFAAAAKVMKALAADLRAYRSAHDFSLPESLEALAADRKIPPSRLTSQGEAAKPLVFVKGATVGSEREILIYDPDSYCQDEVLIVDCYGVPDEVPGGEFQGWIARQRSYAQRGSQDMFVALGEPPRLCRRTGAPTSGEPWAVRKAGIENLATDLEAYADDHEGCYPASLDEMRAAGCLASEKDLIAPGPEGKPYLYYPMAPPSGRLGPVAADGARLTPWGDPNRAPPAETPDGVPPINPVPDILGEGLDPKPAEARPSRHRALAAVSPGKTEARVLALDPICCVSNEGLRVQLVLLPHREVCGAVPLAAFRLRGIPRFPALFPLGALVFTKSEAKGGPPTLPLFFRRRWLGESTDPYALAWASADNLRQDLLMYASHHDDRLPASLEALRDAGYVPEDADLKTVADPTRSYIYISSQTPPASSFDPTAPGLPVFFDPSEYSDRGKTRYVAQSLKGLSSSRSPEEIREAVRRLAPGAAETSMTFPPPQKGTLAEVCDLWAEMGSGDEKALCGRTNSPTNLSAEQGAAFAARIAASFDSMAASLPALATRTHLTPGYRNGTARMDKTQVSGGGRDLTVLVGGVGSQYVAFWFYGPSRLWPEFVEMIGLGREGVYVPGAPRPARPR